MHEEKKIMTTKNSIHIDCENEVTEKTPIIVTEKGDPVSICNAMLIVMTRLAKENELILEEKNDGRRWFRKAVS